MASCLSDSGNNATIVDSTMSSSTADNSKMTKNTALTAPCPTTASSDDRGMMVIGESSHEIISSVKLEEATNQNNGRSSSFLPNANSRPPQPPPPPTSENPLPPPPINATTTVATPDPRIQAENTPRKGFSSLRRDISVSNSGGGPSLSNWLPLTPTATSLNPTISNAEGAETIGGGYAKILTGLGRISALLSQNGDNTPEYIFHQRLGTMHSLLEAQRMGGIVVQNHILPTMIATEIQMMRQRCEDLRRQRETMRPAAAVNAKNNALKTIENILASVGWNSIELERRLKHEVERISASNVKMEESTTTLSSNETLGTTKMVRTASTESTPRASLATASALVVAGGPAHILEKGNKKKKSGGTRVNGNRNNKNMIKASPKGSAKGSAKSSKKGSAKGSKKGSTKDAPTAVGSVQGPANGVATEASPPPPKKSSPRSSGQKASKTLARVRTSYENSIKDSASKEEGEPKSPHLTESDIPPAKFADESEATKQIQFLKVGGREGAVDFNDKVTFRGDIDDRFASVPLRDDDVVPNASEATTILPPARPREAVDSFPTMAPPMLACAPPQESEKSLENLLKKKKKKKKKGKKQRAGGVDVDDGGAGGKIPGKKGEKQRDRVNGVDRSESFADSGTVPKKKKGKKQRDLESDVDSANLAEGGVAPKKGKKRGQKSSDAADDGDDLVEDGKPLSGTTSQGKKRRREKGVEDDDDASAGGMSGILTDDPLSVAAGAPKRKHAKGKKSKCRKGEKGESEGADRSAANPTMDGASVGVEPLPPPRKMNKTPRNQTLPMTSSAAVAERKRYAILTDENPRRMFNPLLRLPQFPDGGGGSNTSGRSSPRIEDIPQAGELWNLADVHFADPDTWPISYLSRALGFDVPEEGVGREFGGDFDPMTVPVMVDGSDGIYTKNTEDCAAMSLASEKSVAASFFHRVLKGSDETTTSASTLNSSKDIITCSNIAQNGMADDLNLSYCDPLWANILSSYRGYKFNEDDFKDVSGKSMGFEDVLNEHCLAYARERGVLLPLAKDAKKIEESSKARNKRSAKKEEGNEENKGCEEEQNKSVSEDEKKERGEGSEKKEEGVGSCLNFRFGTGEDEELLRSLADKCRRRFHPKHDPSISLRSQGHFCIIAEKSSPPISISSSDRKKEVVAFLQYRFCWYRIEEKKVGNVSTDKISELVTFIDNLVYADAEHIGGELSKDEPSTTNASANDLESRKAAGETPPKLAVSTRELNSMEGGESTETTVLAKELETAKVLLTSLALVHAARVGVWYGMTESPIAQVPFFMKYFRMSNISRQEESSDTVPLVFDVKKCHFKYAILLLEESLKLQSTTTPSSGPKRKYCDIVGNERMIVHLHNSGGNVSGVLSNADPKEGAFPPKKHQKAHVRLVRNLNTEPSINSVELFSVSTAASASGETRKNDAVRTGLDPSTIDITADWNVLRSFPLRSSYTSSEAPVTDSFSGDGSISNDIFLSELREKQKQLLSLESSIETSSRTILSKAHQEQTAFATGDHLLRAEHDRNKLAEYNAVQTRLREAELAWQAQLDQDMDAVCDVCGDGEVTPENQIIFCDACNVAVHQRCYGIDAIPSGAYFCHTCTHFEIDKEVSAARRRAGSGPAVKITRPSVVCELCPRRQGAFVEVQCTVATKKARWVHVGCAKWQGMNYVDIEKKDKIEDLTALKEHFKVQDVACCLCKSSIGALHPCRAHGSHGCDKWLHLTCARSLGKCSVQHGENCEGFYDPDAIDYPPWTLACPEHSEIDPKSLEEEEEEGKNNFLTPEQLVAIAASYPPEPIPPKPFNRMNHTERKEYWSDPENLTEFFDEVMSSLDGAKCVVCELPADPTIDKRCDKCGILSHADCADPARGDGATCLTCRFVEENANSLRYYEEPRCHMCSHPNASGGPFVRSYAKPASMKVWKGKTIQFQRTIFGKNKFCHALCGMWNPHCDTQNKEFHDTIIDCTNVVMANGKDHVSRQHRCILCGLHTGCKVDCCAQDCIAPGGTRNPAKFHVTCARQAGFEVSSESNMSVMCFRHSSCEFVFRARLEDMKEIELSRFSSKTFKASNPMSWGHAASLFHTAVNILRTLGWAWRWAEWWVEDGDNWEPLIEPGQVEAEMTDEELRIVHSDPNSRAEDARQCRLAAFGAALRNRDYDKEAGDDREPLERALMAVISTRSLAGPLKKREVEFFVTWLALAYRSKSPILGFGDDKTPVAMDGFCVYQDGHASPKYELGPKRPLPGKAMPHKGVFEPPVNEPDDYLIAPVSVSPVRNSKKKGKNKRKKNSDDDIMEVPLEDDVDGGAI